MMLAIKSLFLQFARKIKKLNFLWEQAVPRKLTNLIPEIREIKPVQYVLSKAGVMEESVSRELNITRS